MGGGFSEHSQTQGVTRRTLRGKYSMLKNLSATDVLTHAVQAHCRWRLGWGSTGSFFRATRILDSLTDRSSGRGLEEPQNPCLAPTFLDNHQWNFGMFQSH